MRTIVLILALTCVAAKISPAAESSADKAQPDAKLTEQINQLVSQLNAGRAAQRDDAEKKLLKLAGQSAAQTDRLLQSLPKDSDEMPLALRDRLARLRQQVEDRAARVSTAASTVTLSAKQMPLSD